MVVALGFDRIFWSLRILGIAYYPKLAALCRRYAADLSLHLPIWKESHRRWENLLFIFGNQWSERVRLANSVEIGMHNPVADRLRFPDRIMRKLSRITITQKIILAILVTMLNTAFRATLK